MTKRGSNSETKTTKDLAREIIDLYDKIVNRVSGLREETRTLVEKFKKEQGELKGKLREQLARAESLRKKDFDLLIKDIIEKKKEREKDIFRMLEQFKQEEEEMASGLRQLLAKGKEVRIKDFKKMLVNIRARQEERKPEVEELAKAASHLKRETAKMLEEFKKEREEVAVDWRNLAATMQNKRARQAKF